MNTNTMTIKPRRFNGKTFHLSCNFCVFATKEEAKKNFDWRMKSYAHMYHRIVKLPKSQWLINFDDENKPLKYAVFGAYKNKKNKSKSRGLNELFRNV